MTLSKTPARTANDDRAGTVAEDVSASVRSLWALDAVNVFLAGTLAGFGPFVAAYLGDRGWSQGEIGFVLSVGAGAALASQLPSGEILDALRAKRLVVAVGSVLLAAAALGVAFFPSVPPLVFAALVLEGVTAGFVGPAIAAISLGLIGHDALAERLGRNQSFKSAGSLIAAGLMGLIGEFFSNRAIFFAAAALALPTLVALADMQPAEIHFGRSIGAPDHHAPTRPPRVKRRTLSKRWNLLIFAGLLFLFQLADAAILPLISAALGRSQKTASLLFVSAFLVVPQLLVVFASPWVGRRARTWGRRPLLLAGFLVLPLRALLFVLISNPIMLIAVQLLDGISGMVLGVLTPLVIADLTMGTGRDNLSQGFVGTVSGIGAALSTTITGLIAERLGITAGFIEVFAVALAAALGVWFFMPETRPPGRRAGGSAQAEAEPRRKAA